MEVLGLSLFPFQKIGRYVDPASRIDITECHSRLRWLQNYDIPCSPLHLDICNGSKSQKIKRSQSWHSVRELEVLHLFRCSTHTHIYMYKLFCVNIFPASKLTPVKLQPWDDVATKWHVSPQFSDIHGSLVRKIRQAVNGLVEGTIYEWTPLQTHSLLAQHPQSLIVSVTNISIYLYFWTLF